MFKKEYKKMYELENSHFWFVGKRYFIMSYLKMIPKKINSCLDIGSGTGGLTKFLKKYFNVIGVENNKYAISLASKRNINVIQGSGEKLPFFKQSFDLVTIFDVLYHKNVKNVSKVFNEANRVLKKNGYILITDSALKVLTSNHDIALQGIRRFSIKEIRTKMEKNNFKIIRSSYIYFSIFPIILFKRKILENIFKNRKTSDVKELNPFINYILLSILKIEAFLLRYFKFPFGSSLIILAQKK